MDLEDRVEALLKMMTNNSGEDDNMSEDSEFLDSSDQSETETETDKEDDTYPDLKATKTDDNYNRSFHLNKFFEDMDDTKKYVTSNTVNDTDNDILFDNKIYRVIPMKLDEIPELKNPSNKNNKQSIGRAQVQTKYKYSKLNQK
ncbi:uncharacterized protein LOC143354469 isoform X2 [Halictus rubicundus]|uniref:uncharacterized protein LOC143354469 isoform X2 n=1 Tax=Halictus rubicundus TaxID=77578 RepID=UPI0040368314